MLAYIGRRLLMLIPVLLGMTIITFSIVHLIPGNPAKVILGETATEQSIKSLEESMGLNEPYLVQYTRYLGIWYKAIWGLRYEQRQIFQVKFGLI